MSRPLRSPLRAALLATAAAALALPAGRLAAQARDLPANIAGLVTDSLGAPIPGVEVILLGPQRRVLTTDRGEFRLIGVDAGRVPLILRRVGWVPAQVIVDLAPGETRRIAYAMTPLPQRLETVQVTEDRLDTRFTEFERRRKTGTGVYFTREDIEREKPTRTTDLFRATPGLFMNDQLFGVYVVQNTRISTASAEYCDMPVVIDGMPITGTFSPDLVDPKEIEGIEVYRNATSVPPSIPTGGKSCGVIVIWTRNRAGAK